jgi:hypothetical protein
MPWVSSDADQRRCSQMVMALSAWICAYLRPRRSLRLVGQTAAARPCAAPPNGLGYCPGTRISFAARVAICSASLMPYRSSLGRMVYRSRDATS